MANRSLSYFMRETAKQAEIVEVPGISSIKDEKGEVVPFQVKVLNSKEIDEIYDMYRKRELVMDKKGRPILNAGRPIFDVKTDSNRALRRIIVEALAYPNLKDKELMDFFGCHDYSDMPIKVFPNPKEYSEVTEKVLGALGITADNEEDAEEEIEDAKN